MTGQHLLLLIWTLWIVLALVSIGDLLGVILALVFGLLSLGLIPTGLATWRGYVIAWLVIHVLAAAYRVTVLRGPPEEAHASGPGDMPATQQSNPVGLRLQTLSDWTQSPRLQTIFGSVSLIGLLAVLYLRPTVPWKYRVDIPLLILLVCVIVVAEYVLLPVSWRVKRHQKHEVEGSVGAGSSVDLATRTNDAVEGKVVRNKRRRPADIIAQNSKRIDVLESRMVGVEDTLQRRKTDPAQVGNTYAAPASTALEKRPADSPVEFDASDEVMSWAKSGEPATGVVSVELLVIARLTARQEGSNAEAGRVVGITIERRTVPVSPEPDDTVNQVTTKAAETISQEIETYTAELSTAQVVSPPGWGVVSERWVQVGSAGTSTAARTVTDFGAYLDGILHNRPVPRAFSWDAPGSPGSAAAVIGRDAETKKILYLGGIVVGTRSGQSVAISARFRPLVSDDFTRSLAAGIAQDLGTYGRLCIAPRRASIPRQPVEAPVG